MAKKPEAEPEAVAEAPVAAPKSKKKLIIIAAVAVLLAGGGAAAWFMMGGKHKDGESQAKAEEAKKAAKPAGPPVFLPLESFIVNLQPQTSSQFLQADITLRLADQHVVDEVKALMPEVRDRVLGLLATKNAQELTAPGGRDKLAEAVRMEVTRVVDPDAVRKPEPPKIEKEAAEGEPATPAEPSAEVDEAEAAPEEAPEEPAEAVEMKVRGVLFTSFIIQ